MATGPPPRFSTAPFAALWAVSVVAESVFFALATRFFSRLGDYRWLLGAADGGAGGLLSEALGRASVFWAAAVAALGSAGCCAMAQRAAHNPPP